MNPLAWLIGLILPACGFPRREGLPTPPPMDLAHIVRPASPNTALAAPEGFDPPPDIVTPPYPISRRPPVRAGPGRRRRPAAHLPGRALPRPASGALRGPQRGVQFPRPDHGAGYANGPGGSDPDRLFPQRLRPIRPRREPQARRHLACRATNKNSPIQREIIRSCVVSAPF